MSFGLPAVNSTLFDLFSNFGKPGLGFFAIVDMRGECFIAFRSVIATFNVASEHNRCTSKGGRILLLSYVNSRCNLTHYFLRFRPISLSFFPLYHHVSFPSHCFFLSLPDPSLSSPILIILFTSVACLDHLAHVCHRSESPDRQSPVSTTNLLLVSPPQSI